MTSKTKKNTIKVYPERTLMSFLSWIMAIFFIILTIRVMYNLFHPIAIGMNEAIVSGAERNGVKTTSEEMGPMYYNSGTYFHIQGPISNNVTGEESISNDAVDAMAEMEDNNYAPMAKEKVDYITEYTDLEGAKSVISKNDLQMVIDRYAGEYSALREDGVAAAYIQASKETGYDPVFLLALTACEAGWNVSSAHESRSNPYSIGMWDDDFNHGSVLGDTFVDGIIYGANYIHDNWYLERGSHSLHEMQNYQDDYGNRLYYASNPEWEFMVSDVMNMIYKFIDENKDN